MRSNQTTTPVTLSAAGVAVQPNGGAISIKDVLFSRLGKPAAGLRDGGGTIKAEIDAAYVHVPFCFHKCHYCDFYSIVDNRDRQAEFVERMIGEFQAGGEFLTSPLESIFMGGGTPTLLAAPLMRKLLGAIGEYLPLESGGEFTVEANPETVTEELAAILVEGGVNRVSIGCQSFNPVHLKTLERWHDPANVHRSVKTLRAAGIENINLDLIFAIPGQTVEEWLADVDEALSLKPAHMSCYGLVYEHNTPLTVKMKAGAITPCEQDVEADMYGATIARLHGAGFEHYEISNWAKSIGGQAARCRHNMIYWTNRNWLAFGPSASGHVDGVRWKNVPRLGEYLEHGPLGPIIDVEQVDEDSRIGELFMLGLRLMEGIPLERVEELLGCGERSGQRSDAIERHVAAGLMERTTGRLRLAPEGLMLADTVLADLI